jgi:hypothetical protein
MLLAYHLLDVGAIFPDDDMRKHSRGPTFLNQINSSGSLPKVPDKIERSGCSSRIQTGWTEIVRIKNRKQLNRFHISCLDPVYPVHPC